MRTGCQGQEPSPISLSIQSSFGQWRAQDRCTCRCSWRRRSTKNCGVRTGERTGRSAKIRSGWVCWHQTSPRWRCPTWWEFWATSRSWTRPRWRRRSAPRWLSKLNLEYSNECGLVIICSDCQAQDRSWDGEPGEKIDSCSEEGEEREEAEGGCHLRHQCGGLQVTNPNKSEKRRAMSINILPELKIWETLLRNGSLRRMLSSCSWLARSSSTRWAHFLIFPHKINLIDFDGSLWFFSGCRS